MKVSRVENKSFDGFKRLLTIGISRHLAECYDYHESIFCVIYYEFYVLIQSHGSLGFGLVFWMFVLLCLHHGIRRALTHCNDYKNKWLLTAGRDENGWPYSNF